MHLLILLTKSWHLNYRTTNSSLHNPRNLPKISFTQGDKTASDKFKEATEAYEILSDDKKRKLYDSYGHAGIDPSYQSGGGGSPFEGFQGFSGFQGGDGSFHFTSQGGGNDEIDPEELFEAFFCETQEARSEKRSRFANAREAFIFGSGHGCKERFAFEVSDLQ